MLLALGAEGKMVPVKKLGVVNLTQRWRGYA